MTTNGADFSVAGSFRFYTPRALAHLFPLSGPISGGSALGLRSGTGTFDIGDDAMAHYTCRVGEETFVATRVDDELFCVTPPLNAANISMVGIDASTPLPFAVSVNGQQFSIEDITFIYIPSVFEAQAPLSLVPISGPTTIGEWQRCEWQRCSFSLGEIPAGAQRAAVSLTPRGPSLPLLLLRPTNRQSPEPRVWPDRWWHACARHG